jgi:methionine-rich copper-binding protein CopC
MPNTQTTALNTLAAFAASVGLLAMAGQAAAHAHLLSSTPTAGATVTTPKAIVMHFSEKLEPKFSGADLAKADGSPLGSTTLIAPADTKTVTLSPSAPLAAGAYKVSWHVVSADGHRTKGDIVFTVQ